MNRSLLIVALTLVASIAVAGEPTKPAKPIGTWKCIFPDGSMSITVEDNRLLFTGHGPGERVSTMSAPKYEISEEGVLFGYFVEVVSTLGEEETRFKNLRPFAFRFKVKGDTLAVGEMNIWGADMGSKAAGDYKREATKAASKPQSEVKR